MKSSSSKLYVFGVNEGYQDPFFGEVETIFGEEMMSGCVAGGGENGSSTGQGKEQEQATGKNCVLQRRERRRQTLNGKQDGRCDGLGSLGYMQMDPLNSPHCEPEMKIIVKGVFETKKNVQHLDSTQIVPDGRRFE